MMEERDLPVGTAGGELLVQPLELLGVDIVAVDREEANAVLGLEAVVLLVVHIEQLVLNLARIVVIAERRVELHAAVDQRLVRDRELLLIVARTFPPIQVVARHQDELERKLRTPVDHLPGDSILSLAGLSAVADDGELDRVRFVRQSQVLPCHGERQADDQEYSNEKATHDSSPLAT